MSKFPILISDGFGNSMSFDSADEVSNFVASELESWRWMHKPPSAQSQFGRDYLSRFNIVQTWIAAFSQGSTGLDTFRNNLQSVFASSTPQLVFSQFWPGTAVAQIRFDHGDEVAETALMWITGQSHPNLARLQDFKVWQAIANPSFASHASWTDEQRAKINASREMQRKAIVQQRAEYQREVDSLRMIIGEDRPQFRRLVARAIRIASQRASKVQIRAERQVELIQDTRAAYEEQMRLKAPVEYWGDKKTAHDRSAKLWLQALAWFLTLSLVFLGLGFFGAWTILGADKLSGRHFLIVASLGALLTLVFWMAKLIVRIYLGERHLATDAEERRVMTQAYLALINEGAATSDERVVILSALFKSAQDGIVKDDNSGDFSLPAILASALAGKGRT